ncbi:MAG: hypothetical protein QGD94_11695, partial [Planctomycetia bacterium]|nr:hypothetical protein [Planctomycetia bacterium]
MPLAVETIGAGETYTTIQAWEDALANDMQHTGECKAEAFTRVEFQGVAYSAVNYPHLTSVDGAEHDGRAHEVSAAGNARIEFVGASHILYILDEYVRVSWLEVKGPGDNANNGYHITAVSACTAHLHHCIIHNNAARVGNGLGIQVLDADATFYGYRNIVYGYSQNLLNALSADASLIACNTLFKAERGFRSDNYDITIKNNVAVESGANDFNASGVFTDADYNASSDATSNPRYGGNSINNLVTADQFVNPTVTWADTDLTIKAGADLIG